MAIVVKDRVKVTSTTTGTADFVLGAAASGYQTFAAIGNNNYTYYAAVDPTTGDWEVGYGQYTTAGPTLTRDTILSSSAAGAKVSFGAGAKDVFCTYPAEKAIYEELSGNVLIDGGPITVLGTGVTSYTTFSAALGEMYADVNSFAQFYAQNLNNGSEASADLVAYNDLGDGATNFVDMGINSSNYSSLTYPIFTPNSSYLFNDGGELFVGSATDDVVLFAGGVDASDEAIRVDAATKAVTTANDVNVGGALDVTGAADIAGAAVFGSTVLLNQNPTTALQAATKQYVDNQVTAGLHIHEPVRVETTGNLNATYTQGGTTFNITDITSTTTVTTSVNHGLSLNDQIWLYSTAGNGLSTNTAYFVYSIPALNQLTLSLTFGGAQITGLTNASGLTYATRANSGVGATLTNAGAKAALQVDGINLSTTNRVMVRLQTNGEENGVYVVTTVGTPDPGGTNWVLTRATDSNQVNPADPNGVGTGDYYFTQEGLLNAGDSHVLTTEPNTMIIGYTPLTYTQFSGAVAYVGGTNIDVTGQTISLTGTVAATNGGTGVNTVAVGDLLYGSASNTWSKLALGSAYRSLVVNGSGTQVEWNAVALDQSNAVSGTLPVGYGGTGITGYAQGEMLYANTTTSLDKVTANTTVTKKFLSQTGNGTAGLAPSWAQPAASDITGLAPSATVDTTDASNITSGTLGTSRLSGSYTGVTGVGTLTAGTWQAATIAAIYGGTGLTSFTTGDLIYANSSTTLARLADVAVGNALISGGVGSDPSWGKIGLATHVDGTLPIANGGTNGTATPTAGAVAYGTGSAYAFSLAGSAGQALLSGATGAPTWGTLGIAAGGTGETSRQAAMDALAGAVTSGQYLRGNGTDVVMSAIQAADVPTLNQNTTGNAATATTATTANALNTANSYTVTNMTVSTGLTLNGTTFTTNGAVNTYGATTIRGSKNGWSGLGFQDSAGAFCNTLMARSSDGYGGIYNKADNNWLIQWDGSGNITGTGNVTAFSDERYKTNWRSVTVNFVEKLATVKSGIYDRTDDQITQAGVSAQSLQELLPETVLEDESGRLSVAYGNAALVACVELAKEVMKLRAEIDALKARD